MSSQRVFDAGDMYWTCEDLIIDDEAENDFLLSGTSGAMEVVYAGFRRLLCLVKCR